MTGKRDSKALLALTAAAMSLPAYAPKAQAWADYSNDSGYRFSFYDEASLPGSATNGRDGERYRVLSNQFHLLMPRGEEWDYAADLTVETMSGASPWYIVPGDDGRPIQIMSGASIRDQRYALQGRGRQYRETGNQSFTLGVSKERDYLSLSGNVEAQWEFDDRRDTVTAGLGYSHDMLKPTDGESSRFPNRIADADKDTVNLVAGIAHTLSRYTIGQVSLSYTWSNGYLSDPYKEAYVAGNVVPDARPGKRNAFAASVRLRHYVESLKAAIHLDGRYFADDWGFGSDTVELAWRQTLPGDWQVTPSVRWYEQGHADFYRPYFTMARDDGFYSSDYRLSAYGAVSARLAIDKIWKAWSFSLAAERYESDGSYAIRHVDQENPALVDFMVISAAVTYRWRSASRGGETPHQAEVIESLSP